MGTCTSCVPRRFVPAALCSAAPWAALEASQSARAAQSHPVHHRRQHAEAGRRFGVLHYCHRACPRRDARGANFCQESGAGMAMAATELVLADDAFRRVPKAPRLLRDRLRPKFGQRGFRGQRDPVLHSFRRARSFRAGGARRVDGVGSPAAHRRAQHHALNGHRSDQFGLVVHGQVSCGSGGLYIRDCDAAQAADAQAIVSLAASHAAAVPTLL